MVTATQEDNNQEPDQENVNVYQPIDEKIFLSCIITCLYGKDTVKEALKPENVANVITPTLMAFGLLDKGKCDDFVFEPYIFKIEKFLRTLSGIMTACRIEDVAPLKFLINSRDMRAFVKALARASSNKELVISLLELNKEKLDNLNNNEGA